MGTVPMAGLGSPLSPYNRLAHPYGYLYSGSSVLDSMSGSYPYSHRYGPYWHSQYYQAKFCIDEDGNQLSEEEARANFEAEWEREESRVAQLKCLEEREVSRVQQESRNGILAKVSARYAEVADAETLDTASQAAAADTLRHGWSGTREDRMMQDSMRWKHPYFYYSSYPQWQSYHSTILPESVAPTPYTPASVGPLTH